MRNPEIRKRESRLRLVSRICRPIGSARVAGRTGISSMKRRIDAGARLTLRDNRPEQEYVARLALYSK
jgi:hypothetical protein